MIQIYSNNIGLAKLTTGRCGTTYGIIWEGLPYGTLVQPKFFADGSILCNWSSEYLQQ